MVLADDLAARLNASSRKVHRLVAKHIGLTPHALSRQQRTQDAAEHIQPGQRVSLSEIAADHGFSDQAHFVQEFWRAPGRTAGKIKGTCKYVKKSYYKYLIAPPENNQSVQLLSESLHLPST